MRQRLRTGLLAIVASASALPALAQQTAPAGALAAKAAIQPQAPNLNQILATVNAQPITRAEFEEFRSSNPGPINERDVYEYVIDLLANNLLMRQFLAKQRVQVTDAELDKAVAARAEDIKAQGGRDLATLLAERGKDLNWLRAQLTPVLAWNKYIDLVTQDPAVLKKYSDGNKDLFTRVQVKASHILLLVPPDSSPTAKDAARQKLATIKAEIDGGKISFADAANKYSEDEKNKTAPSGGDIGGYFLRKGQIVESISAKAFSMPAGQVSEPFESEFGYHLILVTDRKPGVPFDLEQQKTAVLNQYKADLMERILINERKTAKIEIKPIPADLFPPAAQPQPQPAAGAPATKGAAPGAPAGPGAPR
jgi:peptidyl-prolyl cis-trans isomerase C